MSIRHKVFIAGVGGQGTITATIIIGEAAIAAGLNVVTSELHGMAQRGGVVMSEVLVGDMHAATIPDGTADVLLVPPPMPLDLSRSPRDTLYKGRFLDD